jgi:hypothetical protein
MSENDSSSGDSVSVRVEIEGKYGDVVDKLQASVGDRELYGDLIGDFEVLLEVLQRENGGTRSALAEAIERSDLETVATLDSERIVTYLRVLEGYGLVELEGNTWKPGPDLESY